MTTPYSAYATGSSTFPPQTPPTPTQTPTHFTSVLSSKSLDQQYQPSPTRGRPRGSLTGAKRGRKPRGAGISGSLSPRPFVANTFSATTPTTPSGPSNTNAASAQYPRVHWALPANSGAVGSDETVGSLVSAGAPAIPTSGSQPEAPVLDLTGLLSLNPTPVYRPPVLSTTRPGHALDEDGEGEDELLPAMADDDYSAQLSWQSQSKDNLKYVISYPSDRNISSHN